MDNTVYVRCFTPPSLRKKEALRYAGTKETDGIASALLAECWAEIEDKLVYKVCYRMFPVVALEEGLSLGFTQTQSETVKRGLQGCDTLVLFAATVGSAPDRLVARYGKLSPARALMMQVIGAERIESLCDAFEEEMREKAKEMGKSLRPRFSAGYGDFSLSVQKDIFAVLDCPRKIGLTLNDSLLMSPTKSVTALLGIEG